MVFKICSVALSPFLFLFCSESCIKGHRSSACHHTDRPLFEIKKKGRPVSQCTKCRELRQSKKLHSKCTCDPKGDDAPLMQPLSTSSGSKCAFPSHPRLLFLTRFIARRFIPIIPALPNGLKDVMAASQSSTSLPPGSRQRGMISHCPSLLKISA
jgi:Copper fist DNA binding domain